MSMQPTHPAPTHPLDRVLGAPTGAWIHGLVAAVPGLLTLLVAPWWAAGMVTVTAAVGITAASRRWPRRLLSVGEAERALVVARWRGGGRKLQEERASAVVYEARALCALGRPEEAAARAVEVMGGIGRGMAQQVRRVQLGELMARRGCWQGCADLLRSLPDDAWYPALRPTRDGNLAAALIALEDADGAVALLEPARIAEVSGSAGAMLANNRAVALLEREAMGGAVAEGDELLALARRARQGLPASPATAATLGAVLLHDSHQDAHGALDLLQQAVLPPEAPDAWRAWVHLQRGDALGQVGQPGLACEALAVAEQLGTSATRRRARTLRAALESGRTGVSPVASGA